MKRASNWRLHALGFAALVMFTASANAIVIRHDIPEQNYFDLAALFPAVGRVNLAGGTCSGTLIASNKVLTASHCVTDINTGQATITPGNVSFLLGADTANSPTHNVGASAIDRAHAIGNWQIGLDMAIITLAANILDVPFMAINPFVNPVGKLATQIGYGGHGNGLVGDTGGIDGKKRAGNNMIDLQGNPGPFAFYDDPTLLWTDFDNPDSSNPTSTIGSTVPVALESITAGGDSGGPLLVGNAIVGTLFGGYNPFQGNSGSEMYGDLSVYASFANQTNLGFVLGHGASVVPLPSTMLLVALGMVGIYRRRRII